MPAPVTACAWMLSAAVRQASEMNTTWPIPLKRAANSLLLTLTAAAPSCGARESSHCSNIPELMPWPEK